MREKLASLRVVGPMIALIMLVTGCIYLGIATPTEAASLGAFGAMVIAAMRRRLGWKELKEAVFNASRTSRSEEHTSELQSLMRISYAVFCLKKKKKK